MNDLRGNLGHGIQQEGEPVAAQFIRDQVEISLDLDLTGLRVGLEALFLPERVEKAGGWDRARRDPSRPAGQPSR